MESLDKLKQAARERLAPSTPGPRASASSARCSTGSTRPTSSRRRRSLIDEEFNLMWNSVKAEMESSGKTFADENTTEEKAKEEYR